MKRFSKIGGFRKRTEEEWVRDFWSNVQKLSDNECWPWTGCCSGSSKDKEKKWAYGKFSFRGGMKNAHRIMLYLSKGEPPCTGMFACHTCDNPKCVNPSHLYWGTAKQNTHDMLNRNRQARGLKHGISKLTEDQVLAIKRSLMGGGMIYRLAKQYGVARATIQDIKKGVTWAHVKISKDQE